MATMDDTMPRIQITTDNNVKEEKDFGWSKDSYKREDEKRVS